MKVAETEANLGKPWRRRFRGRVQKRMKNEEAEVWKNGYKRK